MQQLQARLYRELTATWQEFRKFLKAFILLVLGSIALVWLTGGFPF